MLGAADLQREAEATGFRAEALEKVLWLLDLLEGFRSHPFLKSRMALKGGTALNLFVFEVPRLSVDIDLNYTGATACSRSGPSSSRRSRRYAGAWVSR
jgi:predicted nucleotidyltransferase component of viral defense system